MSKIADSGIDEQQRQSLRNQFTTATVSSFFINDDPMNEAFVLRQMAIKLLDRMNANEIKALFSHLIEDPKDDGFSGTEEQRAHMRENGLVQFVLKTKF